MWTLQQLQTSLSLLLMAVTLVTFLSDCCIWVHDDNVELHMLTNPEVTFSTYLKIKINTNLPATTMDDPFWTHNLFDSFATARQNGLVSESEKDDYHDNHESDEEEEGKLEDTVAEELPSPVRPYAIN